MNLMSWIWLGILLVLVVIEAATCALTTIWGAISALVMVFLSMTGIGLTWQIIIFLVMTILLLAFTRSFALKKLKIGAGNQDTQVGKEVKVLTFDKDSGLGTAEGRGGVVWNITAIDRNIKEADICIVEKIDGNTMTVVRK